MSSSFGVSPTEFPAKKGLPLTYPGCRFSFKGLDMWPTNIAWHEAELYQARRQWRTQYESLNAKMFLAPHDASTRLRRGAFIL